MLERTPIYNALCSYSAENNLRLHMPGHIGGRAMPDEWTALACLDLTEIPGLDDLHLSQGVIEASRRLLAEAAGAAESYFLVNGASSGIHAMIMSMAGDGDEILIPRNAHRSFYGGMILAGARPVYLPCEIHAELGIALSVSSRELDNCLALNQDVTAVFIASPSYYGTCSNLSKIVQVASQWGKAVLVDEAHGGHFPFHPSYPVPALRQGACAVVNGLHKTWPVFNQGAALHISAGFKEQERLQQAISLLTTTSPSYPLLASIELARRFMEEAAYEQLEKAGQLSSEYKMKINQIKGLKVYGEELIDGERIIGLDPLKIMISIRELNLTGYQVGSLLREKYHIQLELESQHMIMGMFSLMHGQEAWEKFYLALQEIAAGYAGGGGVPDRVEMPSGSQTILAPRQAFQAQKRALLLEDCRGMIAGEMIAAYPPGIPCLLPGELITGEILDYLYYIRSNKIRIQGPADRHLNTIQIIEQS